jgi:hypothetical protein
MPAPADILALIERFGARRAHFEQPDYNETQVRVEFINPLFRALGWDVDNQSGQPPSLREVVHEDSLRIGDHVKAPDYAFRIDGVRAFFVEAKKPARDLKRDAKAAYQLRRYGWSAGLRFSILTDFAEFAVYDCRLKPSKDDGAQVARAQYLTFEQYAERWDEIAARFSRQAVQNGALERLAEQQPQRGVLPVDAAFLADLDQWRRDLAKRLWQLNQQRALTQADLNYAVQKILDRIIFLRICEDRGVEPYGRLLALTDGVRIYERLTEHFKQAQARYNSGLFYFPPPDAQHADPPDDLTLQLRLDDETLGAILKRLYFPLSPYVFSEIPVEILGQAYEQFLGKVIHVEVKAGNPEINIEPKAEVRKAGGVYYTPAYIVAYIVAQTLTPLLADKTPEQAAALRILDPACGSGSFLIGAYQFLLEWYLRAYCQSAPEKAERQGLLRRVNTAGGAEWQLTIKARKQILLQHIYGVDIDSRAVETTKLSLLLRAMEGETEATIRAQLELWHERVLPDLGRNIQCGNALIGSDFEAFAARRGMQLSAEDYARVNYFDWQRAFAPIFAEGGFDAVIGNPPYGAELSDGEREYLSKRYAIGTTNTAALMMLQAHRLLKNGGFFGMIVPKSFTYASTWQKTRAFFAPGLTALVDVGRVWREVNLEQTILIVHKGVQTEEYASSVRQGRQIVETCRIAKADCERFGFFLNATDEAELRLAKKIIARGTSLGTLVTNTRGGMLQAKVGAAPSAFQVIGGAEIARWRLEGRKGYLQLTAAEIERLPRNAFVQAGSLLVQNIVTHVRNAIGVRIVGALADGEMARQIVILDTVNQLVNRSSMASEYLLAMLHSKLINWYVYRFIFARASITMHFDGKVTDRVPIKALDLTQPAERAMHDQIVAAVQTLQALHAQLAAAASPAARTPLERRIETLERQLDRWIYQLYDLSAEEIALVEREA